MCLILVIWAFFTSVVFSAVCVALSFVHVNFRSIHRNRLEELKQRVVLSAFNSLRGVVLFPLICLLYYIFNEILWIIVQSLSNVYSDLPLCEEEPLWSLSFCIRLLHLNITGAFIYLLSIYMYEVVHTEQFATIDNPFIEPVPIMSESQANKVILLLTEALNLKDEPLYRYQAFQDLERAVKYDPSFRKYIFRNANNFTRVTDVCFTCISELNSEVIQYIKEFSKVQEDDDSNNIQGRITRWVSSLNRSLAQRKLFCNLDIQLISIRVLSQLLVISVSPEDEQGIVQLYYYVPRTLNNLLLTLDNIASYGRLTETVRESRLHSSKLKQKIISVISDSIGQIITHTTVDQSQIDPKYLPLYRKFL